jgi:glycosyltransferase involved in cell wall biosynthesis
MSSVPWQSMAVRSSVYRPGVSIGIPNWNHEFVLPRSIGSALRAVGILRSNGVDAEVLVVDDGSRDGSHVLLRQLEALYFDAGLRILLLPQTTGHPSVVRNAALQYTSFRHLVFLDADNELVPGNIHHFYRAITETQAAVVFGNLICRGQDRLRLISNESFQDKLFEENYVDALAMVDRVQVLDADGYSANPLIRAREDWEFYLHLAASGRCIVFVPMVMGIYHELPSSVTREAADAATHARQHAYVRRVFDQLGIRERRLLNTRHLRYHPDVGYI